MAGSFPYLSNLEPDLERLLLNRAGNNKPVLSNISALDPKSGVSGLSTWIRLTSSAVPFGQTKGGLVMDSVRPYNSFSNKYGTKNEPGIIGYELDLKTPVRIDGEGRGLRPSPVVSSLSVTDNRYRDFTFSITAFTTEQLEKLTEYFMEPGFHILCEWGWNTAESRREIVGAGAEITPCDLVEYDKWSHITKKRRDSNFTYDAALALITGGDISYGEDETYTLTVKTKAMGEVHQYTQVQKGAVNTKSEKSNSGEKFKPGEIKQFQKLGYIGKSLFAQMFNLLPAEKQTSDVKKLMDTPKYVDMGNFVNFDSKVREMMIESLNESKNIRTNQGKLKLPKDAPLFAEEKFIRFELAIAILNSYDIDLKPKPTSECSNTETKDFTINIEDTVITGFPHMFSTDPSKLFIPNTKSPNFNLIKGLSNPDNPDIINQLIDKTALDDKKNLANVHPLTERTSEFSKKESDNGNTVDYATGKSRPTPYAFPCTYELNDEILLIKEADEYFIPPTERPYFWGWLKDLYINFDFFVSVISKSNLIIRDVYYELLNGMSSACNSLWNFDIIESQKNTENAEIILNVIDRNFTGVLQLDKMVNTDFHPTGVKSPFLNFDFKTDIPGAMQNSVIQQRINKTIEANPEYPFSSNALIGNVFSNKEDKIGTILNAERGVFTTGSEDESTEDENKNIVFDFIVDRGSLYPRIQDRSANLDIVAEWYDFNKGNNALLEDLIFVGGWKDPKELANIFYIDNGRHDLIKGSTTEEDKTVRNPPIGMYKIDFDVHGVSGFKLGNILTFTGLPKKFINNFVYQVTNIEHKLDESQWITTITAEARPIGKDE